MVAYFRLLVYEGNESKKLYFLLYFIILIWDLVVIRIGIGSKIGMKGVFLGGVGDDGVEGFSLPGSEEVDNG